jgi:hypothetical protein
MFKLVRTKRSQIRAARNSSFDPVRLAALRHCLYRFGVDLGPFQNSSSDCSNTSRPRYPLDRAGCNDSSTERPVIDGFLTDMS